MNLVQMMRNGEVGIEDVVYFEDMFQPGIESLPYIMDQNLTLQAKKFYIIGPWDYTGSPEATNLLRTTQLFNCQEAPDASKNCINIR